MPVESRNLRLFVALALPETAAAQLAAWALGALGELDSVRLVPAANLHITLVFCGTHPAARAADVIAAVRAAPRPGLAPTLVPERVRVLGSVVAVALRPGRGGRALTALQAVISSRLIHEELAEDERLPWLPHITVARARARSERPRLPPLEPPVGEISPSGVAVYTTVPTRTGVRYEALDVVGLDQAIPVGPDLPTRGG